LPPISRPTVSLSKAPSAINFSGFDALSLQRGPEYCPLVEEREQPLCGSSDALAAYLLIRVPLNVKVTNKKTKLRHAQLDVEH
jgi:hypothetical protein